MDAEGLWEACKTPMGCKSPTRNTQVRVQFCLEEQEAGSRAVCTGHLLPRHSSCPGQDPDHRASEGGSWVPTPYAQGPAPACCLGLDSDHRSVGEAPVSDPWEQLSAGAQPPSREAPGRTTNSYSGHLHRGRCCEQAWAAGALVEEGVTSSQTDRLDTSLVIGPQWTELERLPEYRTAGQPVHPAANSLTRPAGARPAPRAGVRGETRDPQRPSPRPRGPTSPHSTDSPVVAETCMGVSGWEALPLRLEGRTTVSELGKLLLPNVGACSFSLLSLYLFNDNKASLLHLAHWPVSVC